MFENGRFFGCESGGKSLLQHCTNQVFCPQAREVLQAVQLAQAKVREARNQEAGTFEGQSAVLVWASWPNGLLSNHVKVPICEINEMYSNRRTVFKDAL